jgi:hypothetical protein
MTTDVNVESLLQKRQHEILQGHPFGNQFFLQGDSWSDLYKKVCDINFAPKRHRPNRPRSAPAIVKLQIAILMRGTDADWQYKYRPQHVIREEHCMILQKRAFFVTSNMEVKEFAVSSYNPHISSHVLVRELAFGPDSESSVRGVALWFNIREEDVSQCTPQQAKRFRWKRPAMNENESTGKQAKPSAFDSLESFVMIRPHDKDAFDLATDMMKHRLAVSHAERNTNMRYRFEKLKELEKQKLLLKESFENQKRHWLAWAWPSNVGRGHVDYQTPVPPVDGRYNFREEKKGNNSEENVQLGANARQIWESFSEMDFEETDFEEKLDDTVSPISG